MATMTRMSETPDASNLKTEMPPSVWFQTGSVYWALHGKGNLDPKI